MERSGYAFIKSRMRCEAAVFGAEVSGHFFYGHLNGTSTKRWLQCNLVLIRNGTFQSTPSVRIYSNDFLKSGNFPEGPAG